MYIFVHSMKRSLPIPSRISEDSDPVLSPRSGGDKGAPIGGASPSGNVNLSPSSSSVRSGLTFNVGRYVGPGLSVFS